MLSVPHWQPQCESQIEIFVFRSVHLFFIIVKQLCYCMYLKLLLFTVHYFTFTWEKCASVLKMVYILLYVTPCLQLISETEHQQLCLVGFLLS